MQDRTATVLQIVSKEVRRYQDSMVQMQVRFGAASPIESVRFGSPGDASAEKGLELVRTGRNSAQTRSQKLATLTGPCRFPCIFLVHGLGVPVKLANLVE